MIDPVDDETGRDVRDIAVGHPEVPTEVEPFPQPPSMVISDALVSRCDTILLSSPSRTPFFFSAVTFAAKQRELPQQLARRDLFPGHVLAHCKANDVTGSGNIVQ